MTWHFTITSEMRELGLTGNELLVYAVIAGYSANGQGCYYGSQEYLAEVTGAAPRTVRKILAELVERGLLKKVAQWDNNLNRTCYYEVAAKNATTDDGCRQNLPPMVAKIAANNKYNIPPLNVSDTIVSATLSPQGEKAASQADVLKLFEERGCAPAALADWVTARKGAKVTRSVLEGMEREARKAGITLAEAVRICAENSWRGFRAEYLRKDHTAPQDKSVMQGFKDTARKLGINFYTGGTAQ